MKKKLVSVLLGTCLVLGSTMGVMAEEVDMNDDGTINNPEAVEVIDGDLTFWSLFTGGDGEWFGQIVDDYNATSPTNPMQCITLVWDDYYTKLQTAVATGNGPDTGVSHVSKLYELAETGVVQPLDDYLDELGINLSDYYEQASIDAVTIDGQIYAIPLDTHCEVMYYNLDVLEQAGVTEEEVLNISSADDFDDILQRCKENLPEDYSPIALTNSSDDPFRVWYAVYFQMGGSDFVNDGATEVTLDEDIAKAAMEYTKSLYDNGYVLPGIDDHSAFFQSGKAAFEFGGTWVTGTFESTEGLNFNVTEFPQLFGDTAYCWADSHTLILPTSSTRTEEESLEAVKFLFYASEEGGITWSGSGQIPSAIAANQSEEYMAKKGYNVVDELSLAKYAPRATSYYGGMKADIITALNGYWQEVNDFDTSYEELYAAIEDNLD
jgi:multiple sugar transport system substrate-binding protein